jgi:putative peptidoglycan lipid II flippase
LLGFMIARRFGFSLDAAARRGLPRIVLAALLMGVAVYGLRAALAPWLGGEASLPLRLGALTLTIGGGLVVYVALLQALRVSSLREMAGTLRRRL